MHTLRPSRLWPYTLKYYVLGIVFSIPFVIDFLLDSGSTTIKFILNYFGSSEGLGMNLGLMNFLEGFELYIFGVSVLFFAVAEFLRFRVKYMLYDDRVVKIVGILIHHIKDVSYDHIDSFYTKRSVLERIVGTADLVLQTPTDKSAMVLRGVGNPNKWSSYIMKRAGLDY